MCKIFEEMTGKKNEGNVGELKGLLKSAVDARLNCNHHQGSSRIA